MRLGDLEVPPFVRVIENRELGVVDIRRIEDLPYHVELPPSICSRFDPGCLAAGVLRIDRYLELRLRALP
jgi:hypothetical protein